MAGVWRQNDTKVIVLVAAIGAVPYNIVGGVAIRDLDI
jgi:hypothetical protein